MKARSGHIFAVASLLAVASQCFAQRAPLYSDLKKIAEGLQSQDKAAQTSAMKELANLRPNPLDDNMFTTHGMSDSKIEVVTDKPLETDLLLQHILESDDAEMRAAAMDALVGLRFHPKGRSLPMEFLHMRGQPEPTTPSEDMVKLAKDPEPRVRAGALWLWRCEMLSYADSLAIAALTDKDAEVRMQAVMFLARLGSDEPAFQGICKALDDADRNVRLAAIYGITTHQLERAGKQLAACLADKEPAVRHAAAMSLGWLKLRTGADALLQLLADDAQVTLPMTTVSAPRASGWRVMEYRLSVGTVKGAAIWSLGQVGDERAVPALLLEIQKPRGPGIEKHDAKRGIMWYEFPKEWVGDTAADALGRIGAPESLKPLVQVLTTGDDGRTTGIAGVVQAATRAASRMEWREYQSFGMGPVSWFRVGGSRRGSEAIPLMQDEHAEIRTGAARSLGCSSLPEAVKPLLALLDDAVPEVQDAAAEALARCAKKPEDQTASLAALSKLEGETHNLHVRLAAVAARARLGDATARAPLETALQDGPEWRRLIVRAALASVGQKEQLAVLHKELMAEAQPPYSPTEKRARLGAKFWELLRLLGWCGDAETVKLLDQIPTLPCAEASAYDGGRQSRDILSACSLIKSLIQNP